MKVRDNLRLIRPRYALNKKGLFVEDAWFLVENGILINEGSGEDHVENLTGENFDGYLIPGLVNSHTHLELSSPITSEYAGIHDYALRAPQSKKKKNNKSLDEILAYAINQGTFFFSNISNNLSFCENLSHQKYFKGINFWEILGFSREKSKKQLKNIRLHLEVCQKNQIIPAPHSIYGTSPEIMKGLEMLKESMISIHLFEENEEWLLPEERGRTFDFLNALGQYERYDELYHKNIIDYLFSFKMFREKFLLLIHLNFISEENLIKIGNYNKNWAWVLCARSNAFLKYSRNNWDLMNIFSSRVLLGSDSPEMAKDVSIFNEIRYIYSQHVLPEQLLWNAATWNSYSFFNIKKVPCYFFKAKDKNELYTGNPEINYLFERNL